MILTLLTDYGQADEFVGVCHAVARGILPADVPIVDITHGVPRHDVRHGALSLRNALPYVPAGVHVAVVDPQVGTERRAVAVRCADGRILVGPDNGLLSLAWERAGGAVEAIDVTRSQHRLEPVSATFHGRDVFVPVAARLAAGAELLDAGEAVAIDDLAVLELPAPGIVDGVAVAHALLVDGYGNVSLDLAHGHMMSLGLTLGTRADVSSAGRSAPATVVQTFADVPPGELLVYEDAWGAVALAVNRGDAAAALGLERDAEVRLSPSR
jgi:S-adenosyl-L-methionine hydrolase (adenosine-forming)